MHSRSIMVLAMALFMSLPALGIAQTSVYQYNQTDLDLAPERAQTGGDPDVPVITGTVTNPGTSSEGKESSEKGGTEDINIGVGELQESAVPTSPSSVTSPTTSQKGNVETNWKVEEGESAAAADYYIKLDGVEGESKESSKKGKVEYSWKVEEGERLTPIFIEIDDIKGESTDTAASANDRLKNAGPVDGWPKGGVSIAVGDVNGLTDEQKQGFLATVKPGEQVENEQDLQNFALAVMMEKSQPAESLSLNYEKIKFTYRMPAKLLGFIPTSYAAEVDVDKGNNENWDFGKVKVKFPWYAWLLRKGTSANKLADMVQQGVEEGKKKGNVEYGWKVEEGEKLEQTGIEPDEIDFMGEGSETAAASGYMKIGDIKGESNDTANQATDDGHKDWINLSSFSQMAQTMQLVSNVMKARHEMAMNSIRNMK